MSERINRQKIEDAFLLPELLKNHDKHHVEDRALPEKLIIGGSGKRIRICNGMSQKYGAALLAMKPKSKVLDLCAGSGFGSTMMVRSGHDVLAIDRSPDSLKLRGINTFGINTRGFNFLSERCKHILPADRQFDCVTFIDAIEHFDERYQNMALSLIKHWLKPEGILVVDTTIESVPGDRCNSKHIWTHTWNSFGAIVSKYLTVERRFRVDYVGETILVMTEDHSGLHTGVADQLIIARKESK